MQRTIVDTLRPIEEKIDRNRQTVESLERLAMATFRSWFVDFDPVHAKANGASGFPGMSTNAFSLLPTTFSASPLGAVPSGWLTPEFGELVDESKERVGNRTVRAYSSTNQGIVPRDERFVKELSKNPERNMLVRRGDIVFGLSREILNFGVMYDAMGSVSPVYKVFRPREPLVSQKYVERMIRMRAGYYRQVVKSSSREGQSVLSEHFLTSSLLLPQAKVQEDYRSFEEVVGRLQHHLRLESEKLANVRDYLLPRLLAGQLYVKGAASA